MTVSPTAIGNARRDEDRCDARSLRRVDHAARRRRSGGRAVRGEASGQLAGGRAAAPWPLRRLRWSAMGAEGQEEC